MGGALKGRREGGVGLGPRDLIDPHRLGNVLQGVETTPKPKPKPVKPCVAPGREIINTRLVQS